MKLSKVVRVLDLFNIDNMEEYKIDTLDVNRIPNTKSNKNGNPVKTVVSLLNKDGNVQPIPEGIHTKSVLSDRTIAIHVEQRYFNEGNDNYQKMILVR